MIVWLLLVFYLILLKLLMGNLTDKERQKQYLIFTGIAIVLVMGLRYPRYEMVYDLEGYYNYYRNIDSIPWDDIFDYSRFEPGYALLNKILVTIVPWNQFIIIFEAAFCVYSVFRFIYKNSEYPFYAAMFYVTLGTMSFQLTAFRQSFAIGICLMSVEYVKNRKPFKFMLSVLIAMSFHKTALVFAPFYFLGNKKLRIMSLVLMLSGVYFADVVTEFGNELLDMNYSGYVGNKYGGLVPILMYSITIAISLLYYKKLKKQAPLNMLIIGLGIYLMRYTTLALERISFFYTSGVIIALPDAIYSEPDARLRACFKLLSVILAIVLFIYRLQTSEWADYRFFWQ